MIFFDIITDRCIFCEIFKSNPFLKANITTRLTDEERLIHAVVLSDYIVFIDVSGI